MVHIIVCTPVRCLITFVMKLIIRAPPLRLYLVPKSDRACLSLQPSRFPSTA